MTPEAIKQQLYYNNQCSTHDAELTILVINDRHPSRKTSLWRIKIQ